VYELKGVIVYEGKAGRVFCFVFSFKTSFLHSARIIIAGRSAFALLLALQTIYVRVWRHNLHQAFF
jgi:hypothetical protein